SRVLIVTSLFFPTLIFAQGAGVSSSTDVLTDPDKDNVQLRERWFYRGRVAPAGESRAELRYRAHKQQLFMRSARARQALPSAAQGAAPSSGLSAGLLWVRRPPRAIQPVQVSKIMVGFRANHRRSRRSRGFNREHRLCWGCIRWSLAITERRGR